MRGCYPVARRGVALAMATGAPIAVRVNGRDVRLTNLDRVLWPAERLTKGWLI